MKPRINVKKIVPGKGDGYGSVKKSTDKHRKKKTADKSNLSYLCEKTDRYAS